MHLCKECLRRPLNKSRHQHPRGYPNDHSRNCLPLWHLSSRDASDNTETSKLVQIVCKLWHFGNISVIWKLNKKVWPPGSSGNWSYSETKVTLAPQTICQSMSNNIRKMLFVDNLMFQNFRTLSWFWVGEHEHQNTAVKRLSKQLVTKGHLHCTWTTFSPHFC